MVPLELLKLLVLFAVMLVVLLVFKKPLWLAAGLSCLLVLPLYGIGLGEAGRITLASLISPSTLEIMAVLYLVSLLQLQMETKGAIAAAEQAMLRLFNNRRINILASPVFMGMLPAPNAVLLSAPIVDSAAEDAITPQDKAYVTSYLRHIPESALPLYPAILLGLTVTGLSPAGFLVGILPMAVLSFLVPYFTTIRKVPKETGLPPSKNRGKDALNLLGALWPILFLIVIVVALGVQTSLATGLVVVALVFVYRIPPREFLAMLRKAFHANMISSMVLLLLFKDLVAATGIIDLLPDLLSGLPVPLFLVYAAIMFIGGMMGLSTAVIAVSFPIAFATVPGAGMPLLLLLLCFNHAAMQLTPTHICLDIACKYFKINFGDLVAKTLPVTVVYCVSSILYYLLLTAFV